MQGMISVGPQTSKQMLKFVTGYVILFCFHKINCLTNYGHVFVNSVGFLKNPSLMYWG